MITDELAIDAVFDALADGRRRAVLVHLLDAGEAPVEELATVIQREAGFRRDGRGSVVVQLHHVHLSKLADAGLIGYDRESGQVQYVGGSEIATLLGTAPQGPIPE